MLEFLEALLVLFLKNLAAPVATQVIEDGIKGKLTPPPKEMVDAVGSDEVDDRVRDALAKFQEGNK